MLTTLLAAWCLLALTVLIHSAGMIAVLRSFQRSGAKLDMRFWTMTWHLVRVAWWLILLHLAEVAVWALFFWWQQCLPDLESAFYFSGVTYATVGYGDLTLQKEWRLLAPVEGLTGILMCGLSASFFFALSFKMFAAKMGVKTQPPL